VPSEMSAKLLEPSDLARGIPPRSIADVLSTRGPLPLPDALPLSSPPDLEARLLALGVELDATTIARLGDYLARLLAMNEHMNLTAITSPSEAWTRHILDALSLVPHLANLPPGSRVLDVGSGGGVPGIPLAIVLPALRFTLIDATAKKAAFLRAAAAALTLQNVDVIAARAEELARTPLRGSACVVTARAVGKISVMLDWTAPFARPGGLLLFIKGERAEQELADAAKRLARWRCKLESSTRTPTGRVIALRVG